MFAKHGQTLQERYRTIEQHVDDADHLRRRYRPSKCTFTY